MSSYKNNKPFHFRDLEGSLISLNPENNTAIELALDETLLVARYFYLGGATRIGRIIPVATTLTSEHIGRESLIGMTGFSDRHETEKLIGMKRNH